MRQVSIRISSEMLRDLYAASSLMKARASMPAMIDMEELDTVPRVDVLICPTRRFFFGGIASSRYEARRSCRPKGYAVRFPLSEP
jgi:hypothetical protein